MHVFSINNITRLNLSSFLHHFLRKAPAFLLNIVFFRRENLLQNRSIKLIESPKLQDTVASERHRDLPSSCSAQIINQSGVLMQSSDICSQSSFHSSNIHHSTKQHRSNLFRILLHHFNSSLHQSHFPFPFSIQSVNSAKSAVKFSPPSVDPSDASPNEQV